MTKLASTDHPVHEFIAKRWSPYAFSDRPISKADLRSLTSSGIYLMAGGSGTATWQSALLGPVISRFGRGRVVFLLAESRRKDLIDVGKLFEAGKVTPIIDRSYPLCDAGEALRRVGEKQGIGKVLIVP